MLKWISATFYHGTRLGPLLSLELNLTRPEAALELTYNEEAREGTWASLKRYSFLISGVYIVWESKISVCHRNKFHFVFIRFPCISTRYNKIYLLLLNLCKEKRGIEIFLAFSISLLSKFLISASYWLNNREILYYKFSKLNFMIIYLSL